MKNKIATIAALATVLTLLGGCASDPDLVSAQANNTMPPDALAMNCAACHAIDHKVVGPAWKDIGERYRGAIGYQYNDRQYPLVEGLAQKVSHGGSGSWGSMPMPALDPSDVQRERIEKLVRLILKLRNP